MVIYVLFLVYNRTTLYMRMHALSLVLQYNHVIYALSPIAVQPRCMWGDMRFPANKDICPFPACGKCRCIPIGNDDFKWVCPENCE